MKKPTNKVAMQKLAKAITALVYEAMVVELNGQITTAEEVEAASEEYRKRICKLPTNDLRFILKCHQKGIFGRQEDTLSAISSELLERAVTGHKDKRFQPIKKKSAKRRR